MQSLGLIGPRPRLQMTMNAVPSTLQDTVISTQQQKEDGSASPKSLVDAILSVLRKRPRGPSCIANARLR